MRTLNDYFVNQSNILSKKIAAMTLADFLKSDGNSFVATATELVNSVLPAKELAIHIGKTASFPNSGGKDVIEKTWVIYGELIEFMPSHIQEARRSHAAVSVQLLMNLGALERQDVLTNRKAHLEAITEQLKNEAGSINDAVTTQRKEWIIDVTRQLSEFKQQLLTAAQKKKEADDFLNS